MHKYEESKQTVQAMNCHYSEDPKHHPNVVGDYSKSIDELLGSIDRRRDSDVRGERNV